MSRALLLTCATLTALAFGIQLDAQVLGGQYAHAWLAAPPSAHTTGLGGWQLTLDSRDPALSSFSPALVTEAADRVVQLSQDFQKADVGRSMLSGGYHLDGLDADVAVNLQYAGYGEFEGRDERGVATAPFRASEYGLGLAFAKTFNARLRVGAGLQVVGGSIEAFNSFGLGFSAGATYSPDTLGRTLVGLQLQHAGVLLNGYTDERDVLPTAASIGISRRLRYLPLRVGLLYRRLDRWDLLYDDPERRESTVLIGGEASERGAAAEFVDNFTRHLAVNAEFYLGKNDVVQLRLGYDHQRQRESRVGEFRSLAGFSYGFGLNFRRFRLDYGHGIQHLAGGPHHLGLLIDLGA